jgi:hypothetical protein
MTGCNIPQDIAEIRKSVQLMETDTEALADENVKDPAIRQKRTQKRNSVPPANNGMDWLNSDLIMMIIMSLLGVSSLKHGGQMVGGLGKLLSSVANKKGKK